jgi:hypothetical protein
MSAIRSLAAAFAALACLAAPAAALAAPTGLFGNTLTITSADGKVTKVEANADGSYSRTNPAGEKATGTWSETGDQICFAHSDGRPPICIAKITQKVGDTWQAEIGGKPMTLTIVAGR